MHNETSYLTRWLAWLDQGHDCHRMRQWTVWDHQQETAFYCHSRRQMSLHDWRPLLAGTPGWWCPGPCVCQRRRRVSHRSNTPRNLHTYTHAHTHTHARWRCWEFFSGEKNGDLEDESRPVRSRGEPRWKLGGDADFRRNCVVIITFSLLNTSNCDQCSRKRMHQLKKTRKVTFLVSKNT